LQAFDEEDPQAAWQALNSPFIKHMDVEYSRLARDLRLPEGEVPVSKPSVRENAAPSYVSPKALSATAGNVEVGAHILGGGGINSLHLCGFETSTWYKFTSYFQQLNILILTLSSGIIHCG